ncbi:peptidylprolyl isomerase [Candidatus Micrarchaeota archaeon]|nr:peptidylprolyl isomerase [Candidatus Micrarchaeota archaeon]
MSASTPTASPSAAPARVVVKNSDVVNVDYVGSLEDGTVFDTSIESEARKAGLPLRSSYEPLEFTVGAGQMIAGFDAGVVGMAVGETKTLRLPPEQAYGQQDPAQILQFPVADLEQVGVNASVGVHVTAQNGARGVITSVSNGNATLDFNHELAGKTLVFNVTMVKIN